MRLTTEFVVSALVRRAETAGAYATVLRNGDPTAGAIYVLVDGRAGTVALFGPAPAYAADPDAMPADAALTGNRLFSAIPLQPEPSTRAAMDAIDREARMDPDLWLVEIEDRAMRSFLPIIEV
ncbi:MAG: DUF1491 family protein [Devosiaceae bacterium]|nr:DUF1491 family protein [Devosiaceae bacterium MH13]